MNDQEDGGRLTPADRPREAGPAETDPEGRRPTPVRVVMEGGEADGSERGEDTRVIRDDDEGGEWVVTVTGRSAGGVLPLRTVRLLELNFSRADEPLKVLRQAILPGDDLAEISDEELLGSLRISKPFREPKRDPPGGDRGGRGVRRRKPPKS